MTLFDYLPFLRRLTRSPRRGHRRPVVTRPGVECLEDRLTPAAIAWTGAGANDLWSNPTNWSLNRVPGVKDDVLIDIAGDHTISFTGGNTTVKSLVCKESLQLTGGRLSSAGTFQVADADFFFSGGSLGGTVRLSNVDLTLNTNGSATFLLLGDENTLSGNVGVGQWLIIRADAAAGGDAKVIAGSGFTNNGRISLQGAGASSATLQVAGSLFNPIGGQIEFTAGPGVLDADVRNNGFISVQASAQMGNGGNGTLNRNGGFIQILDGSTLTWDAVTPVNEFPGIISGFGAVVASGGPISNQGIIDLVETDDVADPNAPTVLDARRFSSWLTVTYFSPAGMDPATVTNPASYIIKASGGDGQFGQANDVSLTPSQITYDPTTGVATLRFSHPLPADVMQLTIVSSAVKDVVANPLLSQSSPANYLFRFPSAGPALVNIDLRAKHDTGISASDDLTRKRRPAFDVTVPEAGTIKMDWNKDGITDLKLKVKAGGTYKMKAGPLRNGTNTIYVRFQGKSGVYHEAALDVTIDRKGPRLLWSNIEDTALLSSVDVLFSEFIDPGTFTPDDIVLKTPAGVVIPITGITGGGASYTLHFAETPTGPLRLRVGPDISDLAGNRMDQDADGTKGETSEDVGVSTLSHNHAPVLDDSYTLSLAQIRNTGNVLGTLVRDLLNPGVDLVTDVDVGAKEGIAVIEVDDTNGTWQYTTDGGFTWKAFGAVSPSSARLLAANNKTAIRFVPKAGFVGTVVDGLVFHAWDQTLGANAGVLSVAQAAEAATFSAEVEGVTVKVTA